MKLISNNQSVFKQLVNDTATEFGKSIDEITKDYFLAVVLSSIVQEDKDECVVLKGGTSLSKCFHITNRFSEDLDLAIDLSKISNLSKNKCNAIMYNAVKNGLNKIGFEFCALNKEQGISKHRAMNIIKVQFPYEITQSELREYGRIEAETFSPAYPVISSYFQSYLGEYIENKIENSQNIMDDFNELKKFQVLAQKPERTMIDKVFALADAPLRAKEDTAFQSRSRDLYDIVKIDNYLQYHNFSFQSFSELIEEVRLQRYKKQKTALASKPGIIPMKAIEKTFSDFYKELEEDYLRRTKGLISRKENIIEFDELVSDVRKILKHQEWSILNKPNPNVDIL
ncbi:nucleotidyl transferase AbiEii/AbiGii toxin family protein [Limosilactobacillus reuteri]|uniref:Nucleotidyl transferase AbiEii/AbiGii toxin family protein n=1 Tax=Limosilactobacillus reuteri TaxID=1598 RepID=A0AB36AFH7_LIMRT|nr:nucleotidyl transferase AbiEii/AbiGii toxin family protein [Limosilactobacillus reuteri]MRG84425.1 hypothetical protein [Limosilactobacillus reuteri]